LESLETRGFRGIDSRDPGRLVFSQIAFFSLSCNHIFLMGKDRVNFKEVGSLRENLGPGNPENAL
jgi:hypothetical protein